MDSREVWTPAEFLELLSLDGDFGDRGEGSGTGGQEAAYCVVAWGEVTFEHSSVANVREFRAQGELAQDLGKRPPV